MDHHILFCIPTTLLISLFSLSLFTVLNVAAGKAPMQISTEGAGIPQKAIDGSTSSFFQADTCSLTKPEKSPWWYVNLLEPYMVQLVRLDFGKPCCGKLQGWISNVIEESRKMFVEVF